MTELERKEFLNGRKDWDTFNSVEEFWGKYKFHENMNKVNASILEVSRSEKGISYIIVPIPVVEIQ